MAHVAVVTDSTSYLPRGLAQQSGISVVPVQVIIAGHAYDETDSDQAAEVTEALRNWQPVTTSRPSPIRFAEVFTAARERGADSIAVITLSSAMSATYDSAVVAAREFDLPVRVIDSRTIAMSMGFAALEGAAWARAGADLADVAMCMQKRAGMSSSYFYVDTLEYLRRGGRVGSAKAAVAQALHVKPILRIVDGQVVQLDQVRTAGKALSRLAELALQSAQDGIAMHGRVDVAVQHLAAPERAAQLAHDLRQALAGVDVIECEVGGVVGAHVGPGMVAVAVSPRVGDR